MKKLFACAVAALALLSACAGLQNKPALTYVLVHGAFQDERAWSQVTPLLQAAGHKVIAVRTPGRGDDATPVEQHTLDSYRDHIAALVAQQPGQVVLVGHSFGGMLISAVAEKNPERVQTLVYVAGYVPQSGQSMAKLAEADQWNGFNKQRQNFLLSPDYKWASVLRDDVAMLFCADCSAADQARTLRDIQREPLAPLGTPVALSAERFGKVDKVYIETLQDRAVSNQLQKQMIARTAVRKVMTLDSGHSPFLSKPQELAQLLLRAP